jgi:hypothetical protein
MEKIYCPGFDWNVKIICKFIEIWFKCLTLQEVSDQLNGMRVSTSHRTSATVASWACFIIHVDHIDGIGWNRRQPQDKHDTPVIPHRLPELALNKPFGFLKVWARKHSEINPTSILIAIWILKYAWRKYSYTQVRHMTYFVLRHSKFGTKLIYW